jgi:hypothetical protein
VYNGQPFLDGADHLCAHVGGGVSVDAADAAAVGGGVPAGVAHQLIDDAGWDAGVF